MQTKKIPDKIGAAKAAVSASTGNNGPSSTAKGNAEVQRPMRDVPEDSLLGILRHWENLGLDARDLAQIVDKNIQFRLFTLPGHVDEAFLAQPLNPNIAPDDPANQRRFNAYTTYLSKIIKLMKEAAEASEIVNKMPVHSRPDTSSRQLRSR